MKAVVHQRCSALGMQCNRHVPVLSRVHLTRPLFALLLGLSHKLKVVGSRLGRHRPAVRGLRCASLARGAPVPIRLNSGGNVLAALTRMCCLSTVLSAVPHAAHAHPLSAGRIMHALSEAPCPMQHCSLRSGVRLTLSPGSQQLK